MKKQFLALCLAVGLAVPTMAAVAIAGQTITINGQTVEKEATELTFSGDNVVLHFSDGSTQSADMSTVSISFDPTTGIDEISTFTLKGATEGVLNISGLKPGMKLQVYDASGRMVANSKSVAESTVVDLSNMKGGVYILRAGNNVIKFVKR